MKNVTLGPSNIFDFPNICPFSPGGFWTFLVALAHGGAAAPWRPKNLGQGCQAGQGWLGQSWPRAAGQSQGPLSGHSAQTNSAPSSVRAERRLKIPRMKNLVKTQRVKLQMHQHFFFLLFSFYYYIEILALILMNLRDFPTFVICKIPWNQRKCQHFFFVLQFLQMIVEKIVF